MNTLDSAESRFSKPVGNNVPNPAYPVPPGGLTPELELAQWPNQAGASIQAMPAPGKPDPIDYQLVGDPTMGGYEPSNPAPPPQNLAGAAGWPPPASSLLPEDGMFPGSASNAIRPQYIAPDFAEPSLQPFDMSEPGLSLHVAAEFEPDPLLPDLTSYNRPLGLHVHNVTGDSADLWRPDPVLQDLTRPDIPTAISPVVRNLDQPDPLLPDLQNPQLTPDVHMSTRPGDLDAAALGTMHADPTVQSALDVPYNQSFIDASGMNDRRRRHFDLMVNGLQSEEQ